VPHEDGDHVVAGLAQQRAATRYRLRPTLARTMRDIWRGVRVLGPGVGGRGRARIRKTDKRMKRSGTASLSPATAVEQRVAWVGLSFTQA